MTSRRTFLKSLASASGLVALGGVSAVAHASSLRVGAAAPTARLVTLDGQRISTSDLIGQVVILTFWATWCVPCRDELPLLSRYQDEHAAAGLKILAFCLDPPEELTAVRQVAASLSFPVGLMALSSAPGYGRIWRLPVSFTIDRAGRLVSDGWREKQLAWTRQRLDEIVTPILAAPTGAAP